MNRNPNNDKALAKSADNSGIVIFDRGLIARRRARAKDRFTKHDFLFRWSKEQLSDRLLDINREFSNVLQLGSRGSFVSDKHPKIGQNVFTCDLPSSPTGECADSYIQCDEEFLPIAPKTMDLVISNLDLHSTNDLPGTLLQIRKTLKDDGLFLAAMLGGETLYELRDVLTLTERAMYGTATPRIFPFADKGQMGDLLLRSGFTLPVIDSEIITVSYDNMFKLMADLRGMGESNSIIKRNKAPVSSEFFMQAAQLYKDRHSFEDGKIHASFEIIFLLGWAPDKSQQKPLAPGSAKMTLAEALGAKEIKLGE